MVFNFQKNSFKKHSLSILPYQKTLKLNTFCLSELYCERSIPRIRTQAVFIFCQAFNIKITQFKKKIT